MLSQEAKADAGKPKLSTVPYQIAYDVAIVREYGMKKYPNGGPDNWKSVEVERYIDAMLRHLFAFLEERTSIDKESGLPHWYHFETNVTFISELIKEEMLEAYRESIRSRLIHDLKNDFNIKERRNEDE